MNLNSKKHKDRREGTVPVMMPGGDGSFMRVKKGTRIRTTHGYYIAGDTIEDRKIRMEDRIDDVMYSKPKAFCKKLTRKIKRTIKK